MKSSEEEMKKAINLVYVLDYKQDTVWSYILSNGYIGTFEKNYKILFNRFDNSYFEVSESG